MHRRAIAPLVITALAIASPLAAASRGPAAGVAMKIAVIADVTGGAAVYGTPQKNAYMLANDDVKSGRLDAGGANLSFDVQDAASDPAQVINLMQRVTSDGSTPLVLGPALSSEASKAYPLAARAGVPVIGTSTTAEGIPALGSCVFRDALAESQVIPTTIARTAARWHYRTAAIIYGDDNAFTKSDGDLFRAALEKAGVSVVDTETFHQKDVDFQAALTRIASKKPAAIAIGALFPEATKIIEQATKLGIKAHLLGGNGLNSPQLYSVAGPGARGTVVGAAWFIDGDYSGNRDFVKRYRARYGTLPDQFAAQAYAAAQIVAALVRGGATNKELLCRALAGVKQIPTVLGPIGFTSSRDVRSAPVILQVVKDGFAYFR